MYMVYSKGCFGFSKQVPFVKRLNKELHSESVRNTWIWHLARDSLFWFVTKQRLFLFEPCQAQRAWVITMLRAKLQKNCKGGEICLWHPSRSLCVTYTLIFPLKNPWTSKSLTFPTRKNDLDLEWSAFICFSKGRLAGGNNAKPNEMDH